MTLKSTERWGDAFKGQDEFMRVRVHPTAESRSKAVARSAGRVKESDTALAPGVYKHVRLQWVLVRR